MDPINLFILNIAISFVIPELILESIYQDLKTNQLILLNDLFIIIMLFYVLYFFLLTYSIN